MTMRTCLAKTVAWLAVATVLLLGETAVQAQPIVLPNSRAAAEGDSDNAFPFNIGNPNFNLPSQRYQQVYAASQFPSLGGLITQIAFRPDATFGSFFSSTLPDIRIDLSTTSRTPTTPAPPMMTPLSATFATNVGGDDTIVFGGAGGAALSLSSAFTGPAGGPKTFDILINLTTPFLYNPSNGNLLLDVRNFSGGRTTQFDAVDFAQGGGTVINRAFTTISGVNSLTADTTADNAGLVTQFLFGIAPGPGVVPEPASFILAGIGFLAVLGCTWRQRKQAA
jgi:hypothetical protein